MVKTCKYVETNHEKDKCNDYYISHSGGCTRYMCRITEWKNKKGVCPYNKEIKSQMISKKKLKETNQKTLEEI